MLPADNGSVDRPCAPGVQPSEATVSHAGWAGLSPSDHPLRKQAEERDAFPVINAARDRSQSRGEWIQSGSEQGPQRRSPAEQGTGRPLSHRKTSKGGASGGRGDSLGSRQSMGLSRGDWRRLVLLGSPVWPHRLETTQHKLPPHGILGTLTSLCALSPSTAMGAEGPQQRGLGEETPREHSRHPPCHVSEDWGMMEQEAGTPSPMAGSA